MKFVIFLVFLPLLCSGQSCGNTNVNQASVGSMATGATTFAFNIYKQVATASNTKNVILSPFSIRTGVRMPAVGAGGNTLTQMDNTLQLNNFPNQPSINQGFFSVLSSICTTPNYTLKTANRIYLDSSFTANSNFLTTLNQSYQAGADQVNFQSDASAATTTINNWVSQQTDNKINDLFAPGVLNSLTRLVLVNAIYFKGSWANQFDPTLTKSETFTVSPTQTLTVQMMNKVKTKFPFYDSTSLNCQILQLNYNGNDLAMYVILPYASSSLSALESQLTTQTFNSLRQSMAANVEVNVKLPKFQFSYGQQLNSPLINLGMVDAFSISNANFSGIASGEQLYISTVMHKAYIAVDEVGTTAAAATSTGVGTMAVQLPKQFYANRPFIFCIYHLTLNQILFMGDVKNPNQQ